MRLLNPNSVGGKRYFAAPLLWTVIAFWMCLYYADRAIANASDPFYWFAAPIWGLVGLTYAIRARRAFRFRS
jgi:hypothetical protein